jgi:cell division ATPase MinD
MKNVIGIVSGKGGVGKTSLVTNLGVVLSMGLNKRVTVVDCNITNSHLGLYLGMYHFPVTLNKILRREAKISDAIYEHLSGMQIIPASLTMADLEGVDFFKLKEVIKKIHKKNDIVLLDGSPGLGRESLSIFRASGGLIFVATPNLPSIMDVVRCREAVRDIGTKPLGIVLNMVRGESHEISVEEVVRFTGMPVLASIPFDKNVYKSLLEGTPVTMWSPRSRASVEMKKLAHWLVGEKYKETIRERFSKLLSRVF